MNTQTGLDLEALRSVSRSARRLVIVTDAGLLHLGPVASLIDSVREVSPVTVFTATEWSTLADADRVSEVVSDASTVIAVGGGAVMDAAALGCVVGVPAARARLLQRQRCGWITLPHSVVRTQDLYCAPTTLGTASEVSAAACFVSGGAKRIAAGPCLTPTGAVIDPALTDTLPADLVLEGMLESYLRVAGPFVAETRDDAGAADALALEAGSHLMDLIIRALDEIDRTAMVSRDVRSRASAAGRWTHRPDVTAGRTDFAAKAWFLGNNVSSCLRVRKTTGLLAVLPGYWNAIDTGTVPGRPERLRAWWTHTVARNLPVSHHPSTGFVDLVTRLGLTRPPRLTDDQVADIAASCVSMWGGGLPMLGRLGRSDIASMLTYPTDSARPRAYPQQRYAPRNSTPATARETRSVHEEVK